MMKRFLLLLLPVALALGACGTVQVKTNQDKLVAAETAFAVAAQTAIGAYKAGVIKPGSDVDVAVDGALHAMHKALVNWRTNPEDPNLASIAMASLQVLLDTVNRLPTFSQPPPAKQAKVHVIAPMKEAA